MPWNGFVCVSSVEASSQAENMPYRGVMNGIPVFAPSQGDLEPVERP